VLAAALAAAHEPERTVARELVWLKGRRVPGDAPLTLAALGAGHGFAPSEVRRYPVGEPSAGGPRDRLEEPRLALQGPRELLARFAAARPDQTVTILAERRPRSADLFVLALDLCPAE
jgi:hypothetical protein